jgi:hypothetical protein
MLIKYAVASRLSLAVVLMAIAGCGGGGGGSEVDEADIQTIDIGAAYRSYLSGNRTIVMSGSGRNDALFQVNDIVLTMNYSPLEPSIFPLTGQAARRMVVTSLLASASGGINTRTEVEYYIDNEFRLLGTHAVPFPNESQCTDVSGALALPAAAALNSEGPLGMVSYYVPCAIDSRLSTFVREERWKLASELGVNLFCLIDNELLTDAVDSGLVSTQELCLEVLDNGNLGDRARLTGSVSRLRLRNF